MTPHDAVLFISFGGPEKQEDVMPFLETVTRGRGIPRERLLDVATHYEHMGGRSPINEITRRQAQALEKELQALGSRLPVYIGQRNWHPFIEETLRKMAADGVKRAVGFITAAHRCEASLERYIQAVEQARTKIGVNAPLIDYVDPWFDHPLFIAAITERVREAMTSAHGGVGASANKSDVSSVRPCADAPMPLYFIAHSIPCAMAKNSTYVPELRRTMALVCSQLGKPLAALAYSSRSGRPTDPWLTPDVNEVIRAEAAAGCQDILFITIGFIADHIEVLFDQDVEARATAQEAGIRLHRTQTVGDHPLFIRMMADVILKRIKTIAQPAQTQSTVGADASLCFCAPAEETPPCLLSKVVTHA